MKVRRIQIEQQLGQIQINTQRAALSIEMSRRRMQVEQRQAKMSVEREAAQLRLDMSGFHNNIGIKSVDTIVNENASAAVSHATEAAKQITNDGIYVGTLPSNGNPIAELNKTKMLKVKAPKMNRSSNPDNTVKMQGKPGDIQIDWSSHELVISWDEFQAPNIRVEPKASVNVELAQKPSIEMTIVEMNIPAESGLIVDTEA